MIKRDIAQLAIYHIEEETETLPFANLHFLYLEKSSDIIYIIKEKKLYGIVCLRETLYCSQDGAVQINKTFTVLTGFNAIMAYETFQKMSWVNEIPVVNEQGELLGDYSRWDDLLYINRNQAQLMQEKALKKILEPYEAVYVIKPTESKYHEFIHLIRYLEQFRIEYTVLKREQIGEKLSEKVICVFLNEEERRGTQCLYRIKPLICDSHGYNIFKYDLLEDVRWKVRLATYKSLLNQISEEHQLERLKINKSVNLTYNRMDEKATVLLSALKQKGVKCFCFYNLENEKTKYGRTFLEEMNSRLKDIHVDSDESWTKKVKEDEFYEELYQQEDYRKGIAQLELVVAENVFEHKKNIIGKYFNAKDGRRETCFQPEKYVGTIYLLGPCTVIGACVEDQYTVGSWLQKKLLEKGYVYRVENYGAMIRPDWEIDSRLEEIGKYHENDIVIYQSGKGEVVGVEGVSLEKIFEKYRIPSTWVADGYAHCNHKANQLIADSLLEMIEPCLLKEEIEDNGEEGKTIDFHNVIGSYVQKKYLGSYFSHFNAEKYNTVGTIVMSCNPFSIGHRYIIEQAKRQVEFLIIFVVEEDEFLFPFEERFEMVKEGTKDLSNIMIVPSGDFVLSMNNFQEYFKRRYDMATIRNAEYDINVFSDYIAKPLRITHRFAGEKPEGRVKKVYNEAMKKILPQKGITYVEIPRLFVEDEVVSASNVRKYLRDREYNKAFTLLPETTTEYLMCQFGLTEGDLK